MSILSRYLIKEFLRMTILSVAALVGLFLMFDFFDRIDNILQTDASIWLAVQYFAFKLPLMVTLMLPVSVMAGVIFSLGMLSKNSEITAMRAAGLPLWGIARPILLACVLLIGISFMINELLVPETQRRSRELYNIDIRKKDETGTYSQANLWWRDKDVFYTADYFNSRNTRLEKVTSFTVNSEYTVRRRSDAVNAQFVDPQLGWTLRDVTEYRFGQDGSLATKSFKGLPLPISEQPSDFYDVKTDPFSLSYFELKEFIARQLQNGIEARGYLPYLYEKIAFPFILIVMALVVMPFALKPARSGSMALSIIAGLSVGFSYYAVHSFSLALGRAELLPPLLSAWFANILLGLIGIILLAGAESPT